MAFSGLRISYNRETGMCKTESNNQRSTHMAHEAEEIGFAKVGLLRLDLRGFDLLQEGIGDADAVQVVPNTQRQQQEDGQDKQSGRLYKGTLGLGAHQHKSVPQGWSSCGWSA